jgi:hypothetical protein
MIIVIDEPCESTEAAALTYAYREHARMAGVIECDTALEVHFTSDDGLWIGGDLASEERKRLASDLVSVRRSTLSYLLRPHATALDLSSDPFAPGFFDREPDAWLVSGGGEPTIRVASRDAMTAEIARRKQGA